MRLLESIRIGRMELRNRVVLTAIGTNFATNEGFVSERERNFWVERAKDVGLVEIGAAYIGKEGQLFSNSLAVYDDKYIPGLRELAQAIKARGAKVALQLIHSGREAQPKISGKQHVAFYNYPSRLSPEEPKILSVEEIENLEEDFAEAARRVRDAGFDTVEFHGTHGFIFEQSLSPFTNKRTDKYGGDLDGRVRFSVEVVERTKKKIGDDIVIIFRIPGEETYPGGLSLDDMKRVAQSLERAGADIISVTIGPPGFYFVPTAYLERGFMVPLAEGIKQVVNVPVITVGRIDNLELANRIIEEGRADLVGMCRPLIADPELIKKTVEGRTDDIVPCLAHNECIERVGTNLDMHCSVNPACGREEEARITPAEKSKKVIIAGGGPGGMEATIIAKLKGHDVVLYEKSDKLGGQLQVASKAPGKQEFDNLIWYFITQINKLGIRVERGQEVTPALVSKLRPDVVIVATGATPEIPDIPGVQLDNVVTANDVLSGAAAIIGRRVVVAGSGVIGVETADFLVERGKQVTLLGRRPRIGWNIGAVTLRASLYRRLRDRGVKMLNSTHLEEITDKGVVVRRDGERQSLDADTVVLALGVESRSELAKQLEGKAAELYAIGDCVEPRSALEAIYEGWRVAHAI